MSLDRFPSSWKWLFLQGRRRTLSKGLDLFLAADNYYCLVICQKQRTWMVWGTDFMLSVGGNKIWHGPLINHRLVQGDGPRSGERRLSTQYIRFIPNDLQYYKKTIAKSIRNCQSWASKKLSKCFSVSVVWLLLFLLAQYFHIWLYEMHHYRYCTRHKPIICSPVVLHL